MMMAELFFYIEYFLPKSFAQYVMYVLVKVAILLYHSVLILDAFFVSDKTCYSLENSAFNS